MKAFFLSMLLCFGAQATITQVQQVTNGSLCSGPSGTSCMVTVAPTGSGHVLIAMFAGGPVSAVSGGGTWVHAPKCSIANVDCWYVLSSRPGASSITGTVRNTGTISNNSGRSVAFYELSVGSGCSANFDNSNSAVDSASSFTQSGIAMTLTGTNDVIVQQIYASATVSSVNNGYAEAAAPTNSTAALLLNTISGNAPAWTLAASAPATVNAIAISEACPVSVTINPTQTPLLASQTQQFVATVTNTTNTAVNWSINPAVGTISNSGLYTAPVSIASPQTITVTATSVASITHSASAVVWLSVPLATFSLSELFGVAWPDQPIEFRYDGGQPPPATTRMLGPLGTEVPYQWVSSCSDATAVNGCIAVRSSLPANANYTWTLLAGSPPAAAPVNPVRIDTVGNNYEITNGLTGVRIVTAAANGAPFNLAPIQGIRTPGGAWTGAGASPNQLYSQSMGYNGNVGEPSNTPMFSALSYTATVVDQGPLKTVVNVSYTFNRPQYGVGNVLINTPGVGHYTMIVTLYANSKSVLIDEDTDMQFSYYLPVYTQLTPDTARWRGFDSVDGSGRPDPICGYESPLKVTGATASTPVVITTATSGSLSNGQVVQIAGVLGNTAANTPGNATYYAKTNGYAATQFALYSDPNLTVPVAGTGGYGGGGAVKPAYRGQALVPDGDAFQDLSYNLDRPAGYICTGNSYRKLLADYPPASHAAGWYAELYNATAGAAAPVVGFYIGRASKQSYSASGPSLPGIYSSGRHFITGAQAAGIQVDALLRGPDGSTPCGNTTTGFSPCEAVIHRNWGIFVSTQADLLSPALHQPIADEQNMLTGINLSRLYTYQLVYADPPGGWQWLYLTAGGAKQVQSWVANGTAVCGTPTCYAALLNSSEGSLPGQALVSMWAGNSAAAVQTALNSATGLARYLVNTLAAGDNHFDNALGYYQLGLKTAPETAVLNAILMNANTTAAQKTLAKAALALFGSIFWDDDWFPIDNNSGESDGLANQIQQYLEYRAQSVFSNSSQPFLSRQLAAAVSFSVSDFAGYFSSTGAAAGSTHYQSAFFEPLILNYMNPATQGALSMADPRWTNYANWELSIQTPPEPRFGNVRKGYSNGDGNTEADVRTGMLGTALYPVNAPLAGNLMWAWQQSNSPAVLTEDGQFVTTLAVIDPTIPAVIPGTGGTPPLGSINVPGYHSVERFNFGTPNETALWFINGGFYSTGGHRHADDGQVSIYALSAPLAIDWNANLYYPETAGRIMHNSIVYDSELGPSLWSADQLALGDVSTLFQNPTNTEFESFGSSTHAAATFTSADSTVWTRSVRTMAFDPAYPIIYVTDRFAGPSAGIGKTLTWNLMAAGAVATPSGPVTPVTRFSAGCQSVPGALPSNGNVSGLSAGLQQFTFTGVAWPKHPAGGINWDLFTFSNDATGQFFIGNWGHGCQSSTEAAQYQQANGAPFAESQHILRLHDNGPLTTILMPWSKTAKPTRIVTEQPCGTQVVQTTGSGVETTCFSGSMAQYSNGTTSSILTVYDASTQSAFGITASGGPQEIAVGPGQIVWTLSGIAAGIRSVTLPAGWSPVQSVAQSGNTFTVAFPGGAQTAPVSIVFTQ